MAGPAAGRLSPDRFRPGAVALGTGRQSALEGILYLDQTLTALSEALTVPAPYDEVRSREILNRIENIPSILRQGTANLTNPPKPFATVAIQSLYGIEKSLPRMGNALAPATTLSKEELNRTVAGAVASLEKYRAHLQEI